MAEKKTISEIIDDHKQKNYKIKFIIKDESLWKELEDATYKIS